MRYGNDKFNGFVVFFICCVYIVFFLLYLYFELKLNDMRKCLLIFAFALAVWFAASAEPVSVADAGRKAASFLHMRSVSQLQLLKTPYETFYVFAIRGGGFVIVSADNRVQPILGYSVVSDFAVDNIPSNLAAWLAGYDKQIRTVMEDASLPVHAGWQEQSAPKSADGYDSIVGPLMTTTWDQSPFYNDMCPMHGGERTMTGCVATAMAQVMKYWNWPATGVGQHSYNDGGYGVLSADFGATAYDWVNMPTALTSSSTAAQVSAVATLMYHCGVAVEMMYGTEADFGSGAYDLMWDNGLNYPCAENAFRTYFKYAPSLTGIARYRYPQNEWAAIIKNEIDHHRPVIYGGQVDGMGFGHQFVCDGYDTNGFFHFNWGWSGYSDGFYSLSNMVAGDYSLNQGHTAIIGIEPDTLFGSGATCTVNAVSSDPSMGSVTGGGVYNYRDTVLLRAVPASGFRFERWSNGKVLNPYPMLAHDVSLSAIFTRAVAEDGEVISYTGSDVSQTAYCQLKLSDRAGIKIPASVLPGHDYVKAVDFYYYSGKFVVNVHQGGEYAPGPIVYSQPFEIPRGNLRLFRAEFETPVPIDTTQNLWITIRIFDEMAMFGIPNLGVSDGNWVSRDDGATWQHLDEMPPFSSISNNTICWLIRCVTSHDSVVDMNRLPTTFLVAPEKVEVGDTVFVELLHSTVSTVEWDFGDADDYRVSSDSAFVVWNAAGWQSVGARVTGIGGSVDLSDTILVYDCNTPIATFPYVLSFDEQDIVQRACWELLLYGEENGYLSGGDYLNMYISDGTDNRYVSPFFDISGDQPVWLELTYYAPSTSLITVEISQGGVEDVDFVAIDTLPANVDIGNCQPINLSEYYQGNPVRIAVRMRHQPDVNHSSFELHRLRVRKGDEGIRDAEGAMLAVSPNPAVGRVAVSLPCPDGVLCLFDATGRQVMHRQMSSSETTIDVSALPGGVYLLQYTSARGTTSTRIVVQ